MKNDKRFGYDSLSKDRGGLGIFANKRILSCKRSERPSLSSLFFSFEIQKPINGTKRGGRPNRSMAVDYIPYIPFRNSIDIKSWRESSGFRYARTANKIYFSKLLEDRIYFEHSRKKHEYLCVTYPFPSYVSPHCLSTAFQTSHERPYITPLLTSTSGRSMFLPSAGLIMAGNFFLFFFFLKEKTKGQVNIKRWK